MNYSETLQAAGFKEFKPNPHEKFDRVWYLVVRDDQGDKFQIGVRFWRHSKFGDEDGWDAIGYFNTQSGHETFEVLKVSVRQMNPRDIVAWFDKVWTNLGCDYI